MLLWLLHLFCVCVFASAATEEDDHAPSIASTSGMASSLINDSVCAISGEYIDSEIDLILPGPEPLILRRIYSSSNDSQAYLHDAWQLAHPSTLSIDRIIYVRDMRERKRYVGHLLEPSGSELIYRGRLPEHYLGELAFKPPKGLTNCAAGEISGRTNLRNQKLFIHHSRNYACVTEPNGNMRHFTLQEKEGAGDLVTRQYRQYMTSKLNGHELRYTHDKENGHLTGMGAGRKDQKVSYSALTFEQETIKGGPFHSGQKMVVKASDNREVEYKFQRFPQKERDLYYLVEVAPSDSPKTSYRYTNKSLSKCMHVNRKEQPNHRYLATTYYTPGENNLDGVLKIKCKNDDPRIDRVSMQSAPVGHDQTPITTHLYHYCLNPGKDSGYTDVFDALRHKTRYHYDDDQHLTCMERFTGQWPHGFHNYSTEHFIWNENNLVGTYLENHSGKFLSYDKHGNITSETTYGQLTGKASPPLIVENGKPIKNRCEKYRKTFTYDHENHLLLLHETEDNGKTVHYAYKPGTDLVSMRLLADGSDIKLRQFYEHDDDGVVIEVITDNGCSANKTDLAGVTERHITRITPRATAPIGLPEWVEEYYVDLTTNSEVLVKQIWSEYSTEGKLTKQTHYDNKERNRFTLKWEYDAHGNVIKETDALGFVITREYDANDNLIAEQGPGETSKRFAYDFSDRLIEEVEVHANDHFSIKHHYDYLGNRIADIDRYGNKTEYTYDDFNRLIATTTPDQAVTTIAYDIANNPVVATDPLGRETRTTYNARGKPTEIAFPDGTAQRYEYALDGSLYKSIAPNGTVTTYVYDLFGHVILEEVCADGQISRKTFEYDAFHLRRATDAEGHTTLYDYDGAGRLSSVTAGTHQTTYTYDALGRVAKVTNGGIVKCFEYDLLDRVIKEQELNLDGVILSCTEYAYDAEGNQSHLIKHTQQGASCTLVTFNGQHQPTSITDALENATRIFYNHDFRHNGQIVLRKETTDPCGNTLFEIYDCMGRIVESTRRDSYGTLLAQTHFEYDLVGNLTQRIDAAIVKGQPVRQSIAAWEYNSVNHVIRQREAVGTPEQRDTQYRYNALGQKEAQIKPDGTTLLFTYDGHGRIRTFTASDNSFQYAYSYNRNHLPIQIQDAIQNTTTTRSYDAFGNMTEETLSNGLTLAYEYDNSNQLQHMTLPDKSSVRYLCEGSRLSQVMRMSAKQKLVYSHQYNEHDLADNVTSMVLPFSADHVQIQYDLLSRPTSISSKHRSETLSEYDAVGNLCHRETQDVLGKVVSQYTYDNLYQLTAEAGFKTHTYAYDSLNNRLIKDGCAHTHNALNQLLQQSETRYQYDLNGNRTQKSSGKTVQYRYDALDRLVEVIDGEHSTRYMYDSFNRRMTKTQAGKTWKYLYQGQNEIGAYLNETLAELRILGEGLGAEIGAAIACEFGGQVYLPQHDHSGNVVALLDRTGKPVETYRYTAFGEETIFDAAGQVITQSINPWRYASKRVDHETQFVYFGNRYFDPQIGRWVTADPIGFADGPNLYAYLHNNPLIHIDAYGLAAGDAYRDSVRAAMDSPRIERKLRDDRRSQKSVDRYDHQVRMQNQTSVESYCSVAWESLCRGDNNIMNDYTDKPWRHPNDYTPFDDPTNLDLSSGHEVIALAASLGAAFAFEYAATSNVGRVLFSSVVTLRKKFAGNYGVKQTTNTIPRIEYKPKKFEWKFPENPKDLLKDLPRDAKGHIYAADNLRIRPEIHVLRPGARFHQRHHSQHYHVETRINLNGDWAKKEEIFRLKPPGYEKGMGTGFLPGESFPGI